jgi:hypothetical protein
MVPHVVRWLRARKVPRAAQQVLGKQLQGQSVEMDVLTMAAAALESPLSMRLVDVQPWLPPLTLRRRRAAP